MEPSNLTSRFVKVRPRDWRGWVLVVLFVLGAWAYFGATDSYGRRGGGVELDGFYYYVYLHSLLNDHDLKLDNNYRTHGYGVKYKTTATGRRGNPFAIGPALLWMPFLLIAQLLALLRKLFGGYGVSLDVMGEWHQNITLFGTYIYGCAAVWVCIRILTPLFGRALAFWCVLCVALGTPLLHYMIATPSYSHAQSALCFSLFVWAWLSYRSAMTSRRWAALGALAGLCALVHPGNGLLGLLAAGTAASGVIRAGSAGNRRAVVDALLGPLLAAVVAVAVFVPQMAVWKLIYGEALLTPQGTGFMRFFESMWHATLFSPRNGLLTLSPVVWLSLLGLLLMLRRRPGLAGAALFALALLAFVNGAVYDWWGWGFGARRYTVALPLFCLGLGCLAHRTVGLIQRYQEHVVRAAVPVLLLVPALFGWQLYREFEKGTLDGSNQVPGKEVYRIMAGGLLRDVWDNVGNPLSLPAGLLFSWRHRVEPARYDQIHGVHFLDDNHIGANPHSPELSAKLSLTRSWPKRFLGTGWGEVDSCGAKVPCRPVRLQQAAVLLPLNVHRAVTLSFVGRAALPNTRVSLWFNGQRVGEQLLSTDWGVVAGKVEARHIERGINRVELRHETPGPWPPDRPLTIGDTGVRSPVALAAAAANPDHGNFADIWVEGSRRTANRRGINVTAVQPKTGKILTIQGFDTHYNRHSGQMLRRLVRDLPQGTIVVLATRDEASRSFFGPARQALQMLGLKADLAGKHRQSYAAIGVKGARLGSGVEQLTDKGRAHVRVGQAPPPWRVNAWYRELSMTLDP